MFNIGDNMNEQELLDKIEALESRIEALETNVEHDDDTPCEECGESPCVCDQIPTEDELGPIGEDDVEEVKELDFTIPNFDEINTDEYDTASGSYTTDEEDSPYYD